MVSSSHVRITPWKRWAWSRPEGPHDFQATNDQWIIFKCKHISQNEKPQTPSPLSLSFAGDDNSDDDRVPGDDDSSDEADVKNETQVPLFMFYFYCPTVPKYGKFDCLWIFGVWGQVTVILTLHHPSLICPCTTHWLFFVGSKSLSHKMNFCKSPSFNLECFVPGTATSQWMELACDLQGWQWPEWCFLWGEGNYAPARKQGVGGEVGWG